MSVNLIAALAENDVIGKDNQLPWHIPEDLQLFRKLTLGKPLIMGRQTFLSLGQLLPKRLHWVLSRSSAQADFFKPFSEHLGKDLRIFQQPEDIFEVFLKQEPHEEVFVIGGSAVYEICMPWVQTMYLSRIKGHYPGDRFFPQIDWEAWQLKCLEQKTGFQLEIWERKSHHSCD